jgi:acetylornithine deacetylase/succinyl-diaminopimelate desuccinylase-like protein
MSASVQYIVSGEAYVDRPEFLMAAQWLDTRRDGLLRFTQRMIATPSPNPPGDERAMVQVIQDEMASLGLIGAEIAAKAPHRPNLLFRLAGSAPGPTLMLCGHSDTKPVGDRSKWDSDPFDPVVRESKLYGLGSTDMKGAVAAMIYATAAIRNSGAVLAGDLLLVVNADEELSMRFGSEYLSVEYGLRADIALLGEPSGIAGPELEYLHLLSRGVSCCKVRVRGTQMHSSLSDRLPSLNASVKLAQVLQYMNENLELTSDRTRCVRSRPSIWESGSTEAWAMAFTRAWPNSMPTFARCRG